ncbi:transpeptidase family protein [Candidatus Sumerlaeota bacterium]|nr:transpeptidase family protein [Candidatus Sumerlaeota bacterium]
MFHKFYRGRIILALFLFWAATIGIVVRLAFLQFVNHAYWQELANEQQQSTVTVKPHRGHIYSRNHVALASSQQMNSLYATTAVIPESLHYDLAEELGKILDMKRGEIHKVLKRKGYPPIARKITLEQTERIKALSSKFEMHEQALYFQKESKRIYPFGELCSHILGFTEFDDLGDNIGVAGIELKYNEQIKGELKSGRTRRILGAGNMDALTEQLVQSAYGDDVTLTIDESIQDVAEKALRNQVNQCKAAAGCLIVMHASSGEILAMANVPAFDLNERGDSQAFQRRNRCLTDVIEPGSVMKTFAAAALLNEGLAEPETMVDCGNGRPLYIGKRAIRDAPGHRLDRAMYQEAFQFSSNVGCGRMALDFLDSPTLREYIQKFGFGRKTGVELPGEVAGNVPSGNWTPSTRVSVGMGYEVSATAMQLTSALACVANGGVLMQPYIVKEIRKPSGELVEETRPKPVDRVISTLASKKLLKMMEAVVDEGTATKAQIDGYRIAGKTGTAQKLNPETGVYENRYVASFGGIVPADNPQLVIYCCIDDPQGLKYGGDVAAPVFRIVAMHALKVLSIEPSEYHLDPELIIDEQARQLRMTQAADSVQQDASNRERQREATLAAGRMPDLRGLTMREVAVQLAKSGARVKFTGTGLAHKQSPAADEPLRRSQLCEVSFE